VFATTLDDIAAAKTASTAPGKGKQKGGDSQAFEISRVGRK